MTCAGCKGSANGDAARYGKLWCTHCVAAIEFEERLARENHMAVGDVFVDGRGQLVVLLHDENGGPPSRHDLERVTLTEPEVLRELVDAVTSFSRSVVVVGDRVVYAGPDAAPSARQLLGVITKYKPLLGAAERRSTEYVQSIARLVAGDIN